MKRYIAGALALIMCLAMLASPAAQASSVWPNQSPTPSKSADSGDLTWKISAKYVHKAPYSLSVFTEGSKTGASGGMPYTISWVITCKGDYLFDGLAGMWDFNYHMYYTMTVDNAYNPGIDSEMMNLSAEYDASGRGEVKQTGGKKATSKGICKNWKPRKFVDGKLTDLDMWGEEVKKDKGPDYSADFELDGKVVPQTANMRVEVEPGDGSWASGGMDFLGELTEMDTKIGVKLDIKQKKTEEIKDAHGNFAKEEDIPGEFTVNAKFTVDGEVYEGEGTLTGTLDIDAKLKGTGEIPVWGTWNERNPYDNMPNIEKDFTDVQDALAKGEKPKKIDYVEGNWLMLKKAKKLDKKAANSPLEKQENSTYAILSVGEGDIYYETGELWTSAGSFDLHPTACGVYSPDLTKRKNCEPWSDYLEVVYNKNSDTLSTNIYEYDLYRVRTAQVAGVWSTVKTQSDEEADETYARILNGYYTVPGVWYSITRDTAEEDVYYKIVRTTVNSDGSARIDTGNGMIHSFFDEDYIEFTGIKTREVGLGGNTAGYNPKASSDDSTGDGTEGDSEGSTQDDTKDSSEESTEGGTGDKKEDGAEGDPEDILEDEIIRITNYDKTKGVMDINSKTFYKLAKANLNGVFSAGAGIKEIPKLTDNLKAAAQTELDKAFALAPSTNIFIFDSKAKTFTWIQRTAEPNGVLVQTGDFSVIGDALLSLEKIKGGYRSAPGEPEYGFDSEDYSGGEKMFELVPTKDESGNVVSIKLAGTGALYYLGEAGDK